MKKFCALLAVVALVAFAAPAFASNPFMDVPMNHWAYDAVGQLAARGIVSGYPDGTYKGNQPITRYEMASVIARGLAVIDMDKASKQDVEMLKRLVVEFKDELDALGVKVDKIDSRLAVLEENLGGWKLWGEFRFDVKYFNDRLDDSDWDVSRYRIWLQKKVDDKVTFTARLRDSGRTANGAGVSWERYHIDVALPWDVSMRAGRFNMDWEDQDSLYIDNDAVITDMNRRGFLFTKAFGMGEFALYATRDDGDVDGNGFFDVGAARDVQYYGARAKFNFNEQFNLAINGLVAKAEDRGVPFVAGPVAAENVEKIQTLWANFEVNFNPNIAFRGVYYTQNNDYVGGTPANMEDSPKAWKAILDVKQDALKFTSLWVEYAKFDADFRATNQPWDNYNFSVTPSLGTEETSMLFARLDQKWNDKWSTFIRYGVAKADITGDTKNFTFGVKYYYTPALSFELLYDNINYDDDVQRVYSNIDDSMIRFRTHVTF